MNTTRMPAFFMALILIGCGGTVKADRDGETDTTTDQPSVDGETDTGEDTPTPDADTDTPTPDVVGDTPTPDVEPDGGCGPVQIAFEAEDGTLEGAMNTRESSREYIGTFLEYLGGEGGGSASYEVEVPCSDTYVLWAVVWFESGNEDSFFWAWDDTTTTWVWDLTQQGCYPRLGRDWYWDQVSQRTDTGRCGDPEVDPATFTLTAGTHTFHLLGRERMSAVAEFVLTNDMSYTPPEPPSPHP